MQAQGQQHAQEEQAQRLDRRPAGFGHGFSHQREHAQRRKPHHPVGDHQHHLVQAFPEMPLGLGQIPLQTPGKNAIQQAEENQPQHLAGRGRGKHILRHHAQQHRPKVSATAVLHALDHLPGAGVQAQCLTGGLTINHTGRDQIHHQQAGDDGQGTGGDVIQRGLGAQARQGAAVHEPQQTMNDRADDQRHDQHLQRIEKHLADEVEDRQQRPAGAIDAADDHRQHQSDQDLRMQCEFEHPKRPLAEVLRMVAARRRPPSPRSGFNRWLKPSGAVLKAARSWAPHPGKGMNSSSSPGTLAKRPARQSALACSTRALRLETKFHSM